MPIANLDAYKQYQALTGDQNPILPDQINANIDAWIAD